MLARMNAPADCAVTGAPATGASFAHVGHEQALQRARDLLPLIRSLASEQEQATRMLPQIEQALHASGLFRYQQPRAFGGMELPLPAIVDLVEILGRGDASTAWTFANLASHHRQLALWSARAQQEIWGADPDALIASGVAYAQGRGQRVDGGLLLSGEWGFSSGVDVSQWNMLACVVREGDKAIDWCSCLVPASDYTVLDDWQTLGMRGTGSRSVRAERVFVPAHRVLSMHVARPGHAFPGIGPHTGPLYRVSTAAMGGHSIAAALVGNAQAMVDLTIESVKSRSTRYTGATMRDMPTVQLRVSMAAAKVDAMRSFLRNDCTEAYATVSATGGLDLETKLRFKRNCALAIRITLEAVDALHELAGASGIYDSQPIQRMFRDAHAGAAHFAFSVDAQMPPWGLNILGGAVNSPTL
jgi:3-hydroxy-9,10-secoandrosta-1,3,5(10)-triene-9,17-dione monooxygenase